MWLACVCVCVRARLQWNLQLLPLSTKFFACLRARHESSNLAKLLSRVFRSTYTHTHTYTSTISNPRAHTDYIWQWMTKMNFNKVAQIFAYCMGAKNFHCQSFGHQTSPIQPHPALRADNKPIQLYAFPCYVLVVLEFRFQYGKLLMRVTRKLA